LEATSCDGQNGKSTVNFVWIIGKPKSKWVRLGLRVAKLTEGETIVLDQGGDLVEEARRIRNGLNGTLACTLVRRTVKVVQGKIVITRVGTWPSLMS
jgi:hypothetical protein